MEVIRLCNACYIYDEFAEQTRHSRTGVFNMCRPHQVSGAKA